LRITRAKCDALANGLRTLPPAVALADLYGDPKGWHPDPDDLDIPDQDHDSVLSTFELLGLDRNVAQTAISGKG
jgi:hypothetical protein